MNIKETLWEAILLLMDTLVKSRFNGKDIYGGFANPSLLLVRNTEIRRYIIQIDKYLFNSSLSPNIDMVTTKSLTVEAFANCPDLNTSHQEVNTWLIQEIKKRQNKDGGWGYEFDVHMRWGSYRSQCSNVIATFHAFEALKRVGEIQDPDRILELLSSWKAGNPFFAYSSGEFPCIHNANLLASYMWLTLGGDLNDALDACFYSTQRIRGGNLFWEYGYDRKLNWSDTFHTGYNLFALKQIEQILGSEIFKTSELINLWNTHYLKNGYPTMRLGGIRLADIHTLAETIWSSIHLNVDKAIVFCMSKSLINLLKTKKNLNMRWEVAYSLRALSLVYTSFFYRVERNEYPR